jgi:phage-related protein
MAKDAVLNIVIDATADKAMEAFDKVKEKSSGSFSALKVGAVVAAGAVIGALAQATSAAAEHQVAVSKLATAYKDAGVPADDMKDSLEQIDASSRRTGQSTEDNIAAYTKLITVTHDSAKAHEDLATAQDLAAYKGVSVASAADAIAKASQGNTRALRDMGIATTDAQGKQLTATEAIDKLSKAVKGQADAFGNTATGEMARYHESLDQTKVAIGTALLPALQSVLNTLQPLFAWLSNNTAIISKLAPIVAILAGAILGVTAAVKVWRAAQVALDAVLDANPIGLIILAIAALAAGVYLAYQRFSVFRQIVADVWAGIRAFADWVGAHWKIIVDILLGPIGVLLTNLGTVKQVLQDVIGKLEDIGHAVSTALGWLGKLPSSAGSILGKLNPFSASATGAAAPTPIYLQINATPGSDLPEVVYQALRDYQRHHVRPELAAAFGRG